jgi:hypothetical protein
MPNERLDELDLPVFSPALSRPTQHIIEIAANSVEIDDRAAAQHEFERGSVTEIRILVQMMKPSRRELGPRVQDVERLVDAEQIRHALEPVGADIDILAIGRLCFPASQGGAPGIAEQTLLLRLIEVPEIGELEEGTKRGAAFLGVRIWLRIDPGNHGSFSAAEMSRMEHCMHNYIIWALSLTARHEQGFRRNNQEVVMVIE